MSDRERRHWDSVYRERGRATRDPSPFLLSLDPWLPTEGTALDIGGGTGRHAIWLAQRGLAVTLADISCEALRLAREDATRAGVALLTVCRDIEVDLLPPGPWDVVLCFHFLWRPLFGRVAELLREGGLFIGVQPTRSNLTRHPRPGRRYLLEDGELEERIRGIHGMEHLFADEGWNEEGRHEARCVLRRRSLGNFLRHG